MQKAQLIITVLKQKLETYCQFSLKVYYCIKWSTHSSILAWEILWTEEPGRLQVHGVVKSRTWLSN